MIEKKRVSCRNCFIPRWWGGDGPGSMGDGGAWVMVRILESSLQTSA